MKIDPMFGITEVKLYHEGNRKPCFHVRIGWMMKVPKVEKVFNIDEYPSRITALADAKQFRDAELLKLINNGEWPPKTVYKKPWKNNKSGVIGVHRSRQYGGSKSRRKKLDCYRWTATWYSQGKIKTASFGETKWGITTAFKMACACREAKKNLYI